MHALTVSGMMSVESSTDTLNKLYALAVKHQVKVSLVPTDAGICMKVQEDSVFPGQEDEFLNFLFEISQTLPGKVEGEFEVWWPGARESGPQWWTLEADGVLLITEGEVVRGEPQKYEASHG